MATLQEQMQQLIAQVHDELKQKNHANPSLTELEEAVKSRDPRKPNAIITSNIKTFLKKRQVSEPIVIENAPTKKVKTISLPPFENPQNPNKLSMDEEGIFLFPHLNDVGGLNDIQPQMDAAIYLPLKHNSLFKALGSSPPRGILLTGTTGSGKSFLAKAICRHLHETYQLAVFFRNGAEIVASLSGESEKNIRQLFQAAALEAPAIIVLDDIDVIAGDRDKANKQMERRVVTQIMGCLDVLPANVFLIATTSHPDQLDPALRRSGRFDKEIPINVPTDLQRQDILMKLVAKLQVGTLDLYSLSRRTPGYVASDLKSLCQEATVEAVKRISRDPSLELSLNQQDFELAIKKVQPTAKREGFAVIPDVTWNEIGSLSHLRNQLESCIVLPIQNPEIFQLFSVRPPAGVLLWGPPGCGKTLLAKAVANASRANFIAVKGPEVLNKYVGESEKAIRGLFSRARASQPCIIFFDEIDAICPIRGSDGGGQVTERVVNQLLTELDGFEDRKQVYIIAASNRPDILDPAILRPGRIDKPLYVPLPDQEGRADILHALSRKSPMAKDVDITEVASLTANFTGADLSHLITTAALEAIIRKQREIEQKDFLVSLEKLRPSISEADRKAYEKLRQKMEQS